MLSAPSSTLAAGLLALPVAVVFLGFGFLIADFMLGSRPVHTVMRWGLALPGLMLFSLVFMLFNIATGGALFGNALLARSIVVVTAVVLLARKISMRGNTSRTFDRAALLALAGVVLAALLIWSGPAFEMLPFPWRKDIRLHTGWVHQLLNGASTPTAGIIGDIPNYYPWLYHSLLSLLTLFSAGGRALGALNALLFIQIAGCASALFALGWELGGSRLSGALTALFGAMTGGFGYLLLDGLDLVTSTRAGALEYMGDLIIRRSPNMAFHNLAPPFPRDVGFALLPAVVLLVTLGIRRKSPFLLLASGLTLGMLGLTSPDAFLITVAATAVLGLFARDIGRIKFWLMVPGLALGLYALWAGPLFYNYFVLDGFAPTHSPPVELTPLALVFAYGITVPFAVWGLVRILPTVRRDAGALVMTTLLATVAGFVVLAGTLAPILGEGFTTLGYTHRYWPVLYFSLALFAALGATQLLVWLAARRRWLASVAGLLIVALAIPSPVIGSLALPSTVEEPFMHEALTGNPESILNVLAPRPGLECRVAVPESLGVSTFAYTGYRMVMHPLKPNPNSVNRARIRWFPKPLRIPIDAKRLVHNLILTGGQGIDERFDELVDFYDLNLIVVPTQMADMPRYNSFEGSEGLDASLRSWTMLEVRPCDT
jgi:hypothetical protein